MLDNTDRILSFIDSIDTNKQLSNKQPLTETLLSNNEEMKQQEAIKPESIKEEAPKQQLPEIGNNSNDIYDINNIHENQKLYKGFRNRLNKIKHFPQSVKVFGNNYITINNENDISELKAKITQNRRTFNRENKQNKLKESKMNLRALPALEEDDTTYREDNYIYKHSQPIGVIDDENKPRRLPKTNQRDRMTIFDDLATNKDNLRELVNNRDNFENLTEQYLTDGKKDIYNQHRYNNIINDNTWTYDAFCKIIEDLGRANEQREQQLKDLREINDPYYKYSQNGKAFSEYGLNPNLLKRK